VEPPEVCDPPGSAQDCNTTSGYAGTETCNADCTEWETCTSTQSCGDGQQNGNEQCDGSNLNEKTCQDFGFFDGNLFCLGNCSGFDLNQCSNCGDDFCDTEQGENPDTCQTDCFSSDVNLNGIYALGVEKPQYFGGLSASPFVDGFSVRSEWKTLEPTEGNYAWETIDQLVDAATGLNKKVMLRVLPGSHSPEWVFSSGIQYFQYVEDNNENPNYGLTMRMPIPWDSIYLSNWNSFVQALGQRYSDSPAVRIVAVTGPSEAGEMYLAQDRNQEIWTEFAYTNEKLLDAWKETADSFDAAFPNQKLAIAISRPVAFDAQAPVVVVDGLLNYGFQTMGQRFGPQGNWLSAKTTEANAYYVRVKSWGLQTPVGFQMLSASSAPRFGGTLLEGIQAGLDAHARYLEIYPTDILNPGLQNDLNYAHEQLNSE
jgi:hypothetical protein